tara:strand:- start:1191 stop:1502 length:312 start_codon:yes stop_codon:yes gene_type:complete
MVKKFTKHVQEGLRITVKDLVAFTVVVSSASIIYSHLENRLSIVEMMDKSQSQKIEYLSLELYENQDKPISVDYVQDTRLKQLEKQMNELLRRSYEARQEVKD